MLAVRLLLATVILQSFNRKHKPHELVHITPAGAVQAVAVTGGEVLRLVSGQFVPVARVTIDAGVERQPFLHQQLASIG